MTDQAAKHKRPSTRGESTPARSQARQETWVQDAKAARFVAEMKHANAEKPPAQARVDGATLDVGEPTTRRGVSEWVVMSGIAALTLGTWGLTRALPYTAGDDWGYWLGVAGGVMMLLLLLYPLRKRIKLFQRAGHVKGWLAVHMVLGVGGPLLILLHCKFQVHSLNAAAALYSMAIVAVSGVLGRFLYVRVNGDLAAERQALDDRRKRLMSDQSALGRMPRAKARLQDFDRVALNASRIAGSHWFRLVVLLPVKSWLARWQAMAYARQELQVLAEGNAWTADKRKRVKLKTEREIVDYFVSVMRVALFEAWERLFALWHVAHVPFVFLLLAAGVAHVVAVHAY